MMPVAVTAITPVLKKYGFQESQMGMMQLALAGSPYKEDAEIAVLSKAMREKMVPAEMLPVINAMMGVQLPNIQMPQMPPMQMPFGLPVRARRLTLMQGLLLRAADAACGLRRAFPCRASRGSRSSRPRRRRRRRRREPRARARCAEL